MSTCAFLKICSDLAGLAFCSMRSSLLQMDGDFAKYVIGINDGWLSLHLDEDVWQSPDERLRDLLPTLEPFEQRAWERYEEAGKTVGELEWAGLLGGFEDAEGNGNSPTDDQKGLQLAKAEQEQEAALEQLRSNLTPEHLAEVDSILEAQADYGRRHAPHFNARLIQRYVLWRVFDLGWTVERFGQFDRFVVGYSGREAAKPERIGKKYQWIAYHEILAHISDHYQYREQFSVEADARRYEGPWQERLRDIDPSCTLRSIPGGTSWGPHNPSWWGKAVYAAWDEGASHKDWLASIEDIPKVEEFLEVACPKDDSRWLNVKGRFVWHQPHPPDVEPYDVERRGLRLSCTGYFVPSDDIDGFTDWVNSANDIGREILEPLDVHSSFLGEYGWSSAFGYFDKQYNADNDRSSSTGYPKSIRAAASAYHGGMSSFDCSIDDTSNLLLPHYNFIDRLGLKWSGTGPDYWDRADKLAAFDPTAHESGPTALLLREDLVKQYLIDNSLTLCWVVMGEKWVIGERLDREYHGALKISGVYRYTDQGTDGQLSVQIDIPDRN